MARGEGWTSQNCCTEPLAVHGECYQGADQMRGEKRLWRHSVESRPGSESFREGLLLSCYRWKKSSFLLETLTCKCCVALMSSNRPPEQWEESGSLHFSWQGKVTAVGTLCSHHVPVL